MRRIVFLPAVFLILTLAPALQAANPIWIIAAGTGNIADLAALKDGPVNSAADTDVSFDVTIVNNGPDDALTVLLKDPLPAPMTFVSISKNNAAAIAFSCTDPGAGNTGTINCTIATLAAGASANFTFVAHIPPATPAGTTFTNVATASASGSFDPNSENDSGVTSVTVPGTDLSVVKSGPATAPPNADVSYDITVTNGAAAASTISLKDTLPGTMTFVSINQNNGPSFDCTSHPAFGSGGLVQCTIPSMPANTSANFTLVAHIPPSTADGTGFNNTADVTTTSPESNMDNNESTASLTVSTVDLGVTKSGPSTVTAGQNITYTISFSNVGTSSTTNARFIDSLPAGTTFVSLTPTGGNVSPSCTTPNVGSSGSVTCTLSSSAPGDNAAYTLVLNVNANVNHGTVLTNTVTAASDDADANASNDSASTSATVTGVTDVSVNKTGAGTVIAGNNLSYSITVTNTGPSLATSTQLSDALPGSTTFVSLIQNSGPVSSCTSPAVGGTGSVTCNWASLASGATANFTLVVKTASGASGTISNTAIVSESPNDPTPGNNMSPTSATVTTSADLAVTKTGPTTAVQNQDVSYTIIVTNNGPSDAQTVTLSDPLPATTTFVSNTQNSGPAFTCLTPAVGSGGTVSCSIATLNAGASATFTLVIHTTISTPAGLMNNTATVGSATSDPNGGNNTSTAATGVSLVDLSITKTPQQPPYGTGLPLTWTSVVTNTSGTPATTVSVTDVLPAGTTFTGSTPAGACTGTTTITCTAATLNGGASVTFTITVTLPSTPGPVTNTATVSSATTDANLADNTATSTITVIPAANIPAISPLALLMLCIALAAAGAITQRH
jgi:uncharacterized repeat protein (TIGR01451 family)